MHRLLIVCFAFFALGARADISQQAIDAAADAVQPQVVEWRRWFHSNPELSNREVHTAEHIAEILRGMGLEPRTGIAHTGLAVVIEGGKPGPLVAIRTDMDGLPVTEETGLPFASTERSEYNGQEVGVMHACGHDTHMAMALGATKVLNDMKANLAGSVLVIFQPAEEGPPPGEQGGASLMLEEGLFEPVKPEAVFGIHVGIGQPGGQFGTRPGPLMAAADRYVIRVHGRQTHGAQPWAGVDPIVTTAQIIMGIQTIASRQLNVTQAPSILSDGRSNGGIRNNVIPDSFEFEGTIRSFDPDMRADIHRRLEHTARSIADAAGATIDFELDLGDPPVRNNVALTNRMLPALQRASGKPVLMINPQTVAEDFSVYAEATPGLFVFLGNWPEGADPATRPGNHSPLFDFHEPHLEVGVKAFVNMVTDYLKSP
jgi:amidohydrolase